MQYNGAIVGTFVIILLLLALLLLFIVSTIFLYQRKHRSFISKLNEAKVTYEHELLKSQLEVQEETLEHISRELHDGIGAQFSLAKLYLNTMPLDTDHPAREKLLQAVDLLTKGLDDLRDISKSWSLDLIRSMGLTKAIVAQVAIVRKIGRHSILFEVMGECDYDDEQKDIIIFRIFQEAINNIVRHAEAKNIQIILDGRTKNRLFLYIVDDGKGFDTDGFVYNGRFNRQGGLRNMEIRAQLIDASFSVCSKQGTGTKIQLSVPLQADSILTPHYV